MSSIDARTVAWYDAYAEDYCDRVSRCAPDADLAAFVAALPGRDAPVLDWGCGPGNTAAFLAGRGMEVVATDASGGMVRLAAELGIRALEAPFEALRPVPRFRGIWANFSLIHAPASIVGALIGRAAGALLPGGILHLGLDTGVDGARAPAVREFRDVIGHYHALFSPAEIDGMIAAAGLRLLSGREGRLHVMKRLRTDIAIRLCRKPAH